MSPFPLSAGAHKSKRAQLIRYPIAHKSRYSQVPMTIRAEISAAPSQSIASVHAHKERPPRRRPVKERVVLSWSGGKDSTMAAYHLLASHKYEIAALLTTVTEEFGRISMHGVRQELLERQAQSLGIALHLM